MNAMRFRLTLSLVLATFLLASQALSQSYDTATEAETGMVASVHRLASEAALEVLQQGGNAVDAAAVVQFVLNVVEPAGSGIGGGNFIMIYLAEEGQVIAIDAREEAPERYHEEIFLDEEGEVIPFGDRSTGGNPVGVPGTLAGIAKALEMHGTITLAEALQPAIAIAEEGFVLTEFEADFFNEAAPRLELFPSSAAVYLPKFCPN
jgi:gamma-glutamyltranspeptidase / glutathione hydrolase